MNLLHEMYKAFSNSLFFWIAVHRDKSRVLKEIPREAVSRSKEKALKISMCRNAYSLLETSKRCFI